ncbi:MAG TPA: hypothetical protein VLL75_21200 [Vicinamibacteria bacterium]|nr:hypothetical protein [Vicinamibacteria bacterium]
MRVLGAVLAAGLLAWGCAAPDDVPTQPEPVPSSTPAPTADPNTSSPPPPIIAAPAPRATPTPEPSPSPGTTPAPGGSGEGAGECGSPTPPPLSSINVKMHLRDGDAWVLDSTPLVGPDVAYCTTIGYTDGRSMCPVRQEGNPQREACELYVTGRAVDTGRPGPTWRLDGRLCLGRASGCENHPDNQYLLMAYRGGTYRACGRNGVCGEVAVDK